MRKTYAWGLALAAIVVSSPFISRADVLQEDFSSNPVSNGWQTWGATNLFSWDPQNLLINVTWDSSVSNSYFYRPLGTILAKDDDFAVEFDLKLQNITNALKPGPFEIAVGLINFADATRPDFWRGSGVNAVHGPRNIFEFDYFPSGYIEGWGNVDPSISPTLVSMDNGFAAGFALIQLTNDHLYHIEMVYTASNATIHTSLSMDGMPSSSPDDVTLGASFTDFRLNAAAICNYSDTGDDFDSVLAQGTIDNFVVRMPPPPIQNLAGSFSNNVWLVQFTSRSNWVYTVERTTDLQTWTPVSVALDGNGSTLTYQDATPATPSALYRVSAQRP